MSGNFKHSASSFTFPEAPGGIGGQNGACAGLLAPNTHRTQLGGRVAPGEHCRHLNPGVSAASRLVGGGPHGLTQADREASHNPFCTSWMRENDS